MFLFEGAGGARRWFRNSLGFLRGFGLKGFGILLRLSAH
jgi:hypothetical protein